jgi:hypothetical protein
MEKEGNGMNEEFAKTAEQMAAFQKIWMETFTQLMQTAVTGSQTSAPPEVLRQMRNGIFKSLSKSWDEFLRSPQFLTGMRQWMDGTTNFRKMSNEWMARVRNELQAPSREDIDTIMLSVRHMEQRLLARLEELSKRIDAMNGQSRDSGAKGPTSTTAAQPDKNRRSRSRSNETSKTK